MGQKARLVVMLAILAVLVFIGVEVRRLRQAVAPTESERLAELETKWGVTDVDDR